MCKVIWHVRFHNTLPPGPFEPLKKFLCRENVRASIRFGAEYSEEHVLDGRPGPQIWTKIHCDITQIHCDFTQIHCDFHQNTLWPASLAGSRTPPSVPGRQQGTAWRSILAATPSTAAISTPDSILNGSSAVVTKNEVQAPHGAAQHEQIVPNIPRTKIFVFSYLQNVLGSLGFFSF